MGTFVEAALFAGAAAAAGPPGAAAASSTFGLSVTEAAATSGALAPSLGSALGSAFSSLTTAELMSGAVDAFTTLATIRGAQAQRASILFEQRQRDLSSRQELAEINMAIANRTRLAREALATNIARSQGRAGPGLIGASVSGPLGDIAALRTSAEVVRARSAVESNLLAQQAGLAVPAGLINLGTNLLSRQFQLASIGRA